MGRSFSLKVQCLCILQAMFDQRKSREMFAVLVGKAYTHARYVSPQSTVL